MALEVLTGLPGSGKSTRLIEKVNTAVRAGRPVVTFACSDSPWLLERPYVRIHRLLGCRRPGITCPLTHFVSTQEAAEILDQLPSETIVAFEEAHYFSPHIASHWAAASSRGVDLLIAMPSDSQLAQLSGVDYRLTRLPLPCQECGVTEAAGFIIVPGEDRTLCLCASCKTEMTAKARTEILTRLERQAPYAGEKTTYQPVELEECANWRVLRTDSQKRAELMARVVSEIGLPMQGPVGLSTYLDVACNTGYFCHFFSQLGFFAEGIDLVEGDIAVARLLDSHFRKGNNCYHVADAYDYLHKTTDRLFDVTSAFSVFQWVMIQTTVERGIQCIERLFAKTKRICFLEMGYTSEAHYKGQLEIDIDREWTRRIMDLGGFSRVEMFDAGEHGLWRDVFVGIRDPELAPV